MLRVWLGAAAVEAGTAFKKQVLLGDAARTAGRVWIYDQNTGWKGG